MLVLLVEDHIDTLELYSQYLRDREGFDVVENVTSATAFTHALETRPNVIVTDYRMSPVNGLELCRQLRGHAETHPIPVIMLTAHTTTGVSICSH